MSMIGYFVRASDEQIDHFITHIGSIGEFLYPKEGSTRPAVLAIEKSWHALHFLLTRSDDETDDVLDFILFGGHELDEVGYGPARAFKSAQVKRIARALTRLSPEQLRERFDPREMDRLALYPNVWSRMDDMEDELESLLLRFEQVKQFVLEAAQADRGLITYIA